MRAGFHDPAELVRRFPKLLKWESGEESPTLRQVENFAHAMHVPIGYLFLTAPPKEPLPIPDFRAKDGQSPRRASPDLLDTIHACQERQDWYREFARTTRQPKAGFVGSANVDFAPALVAAGMARTLGFDLDSRAECRTWEDALRQLIGQAESVGVLVMVSGIVGSNARRKLDPEEFRGFALADPVAPLVFINGADSKSAQVFTLAHELAHLWLGSTALSSAGTALENGCRPEETWCNRVAAELLAPLEAANRKLRGGETPDAFAHVGRRFARAIIESTAEGHTLYRDAFRMLAVPGIDAFNAIGRELGILDTPKKGETDGGHATRLHLHPAGRTGPNKAL